MLRNSIAWKNGHWLPMNEANLALDDWGVLQGATIVDRLRTINTQPLDVPLHLARLKDNCESIGISTADFNGIDDIIFECARQNQSHLIDKDFSIVVLVTPGLTSAPKSPTMIVHVQPLNWPAIEHWHQHGQPLIIASHRNVPTDCWPPQLKTRSRLQYYLADQQAKQSSGAHAGAILLNTEGFVTETSAANILVVNEAGAILCPPADSILGGISLIRTLRLAAKSGLKVDHQPITVAMIESASEVILTGTSACIWPAASVGSISLSRPTERPVYRKLLTSWIADVGSDFRVRGDSERLGPPY